MKKFITMFIFLALVSHGEEYLGSSLEREIESFFGNEEENFLLPEEDELDMAYFEHILKRHDNEMIDLTYGDKRDYYFSFGKKLTLINAEGMKLLLIGKSKGTKLNMRRSKDRIILSPSAMGKYKVKVTTENDQTKVYNLSFSSKYEFTEKKLYDIITDSSFDRDTKNKATSLLEVYYPGSGRLRNIVYSKFLKELDKKKYFRAKKEAEKLIEKDVLSNRELNNLATTIIKKFGSSHSKSYGVDLLKKIVSLHPSKEKYLIDYYIENNITNIGGINYLKKYTAKKPSKKIDEYLGNYYYNRKEMSESYKYYKSSGSLYSLATKLYTDKKTKLYENVKSELSKRDEKKLNLFLKGEEDKKKVEQYYRLADESYSRENYQQAEIYYKRALKTVSSHRIKMDIYFKLAELYYREGEHKNSLKYLRGYRNRKSDEYHYLFGMNNYKLKNYSDAKKSFNYLIANSNNRTYVNKAKIYKMRMNN